MSQPSSVLVVSGTDHKTLYDHLFPGDGLEAAAILLCSRVQGRRLRLMVKRVHCVPHDECERYEDWVTWPGQHIEDCLTEAEEDDLSLILVHSHPLGGSAFSETDDQSDLELLDSLFLARGQGREGEMLHGSTIMLPNGWMRARVYNRALQPEMLNLVAVVGDEISCFWADSPQGSIPMAFSEGMREQLKRLHAGVVGVSGTGSVVAEQLLRLGFGEITVVDHDVVEGKNLNRILNSTARDAAAASPKVELFKRVVSGVSPGTRVNAVCQEVGTREAVQALSGVDVLFCCVDTATGRDICQRLATSLLLPLFDVGVVIPVRKNSEGKTVIQDIQGRIDYVQPGGSTLQSRGVYTADDIAAEDLRKVDPERFSQRIEEGYMPGGGEEAPSVISLNMRAASMVVQEFIARTFPYRLDGNRRYARTMFALASEETEYFSEDSFSPVRSERYAAGLSSPLLGLPMLEEMPCAA
ncbi:ThiF family adenylyltransferase [Microbulbifer litoralis]|uniref:ThiF family adenylyltransferase n=1 Tax=Microbulbifer litoralis TaxID=2933965 RepID=UPI0020283099|nr:ThiF family adenylyltransferase [Microbulbifer sp. GX H0434]